MGRPLERTGNQLDRDVVSMDQIRTVIRTFKDRLPTEIFPGRTEVPKTLILTKSDAHADDLLASFRNSYNPRIAVTVDIIATGRDVKPLECVFFMRAVKSLTGTPSRQQDRN